MTSEEITFSSNHLNLKGIIEYPKNIRDGHKSPAMIVLHGFGSNKNAGNVLGPVAALGEMGYVTMRFDMQGCGESEGERGHLLCLDQVQNTLDAVSALTSNARVNNTKIGLIGSSFGAAVALYAGSIDSRVALVISSGGWGHGERKFKGQHLGDNAWEEFVQMLRKGKEYKDKTGQMMMIPRMKIVPIPPGLKRQVVHGSLQEFTHETAQSMFDFKAEEVIEKLSPRPLLLLHSSVDSVTPTEQSIALFQKAKQPKDLHLFGETDHFMLAETNKRVWNVIKDWLNDHLPV